MDNDEPAVGAWNLIADKKVREWWFREAEDMHLALKACQLFDFKITIELEQRTSLNDYYWHVKVTY